MRARPRGFTLIEMMIVVAIVGILASIAIPAFAQYAMKSKRAEAQLSLDKMIRSISVYFYKNSQLPPSANRMPQTSACASPTGKTPSTTKPQWDAEGWEILEFSMVEPTYYQYEWTVIDAEHGIAQAIADLDCDGTDFGQLIIEVSTVGGSQFETVLSDLVE
jgi:prepilin-type N-terminal cleavage/methylation domain-containing protein